MANVARMHPSAVCVIAGDGSQRHALQEEATRASLNGQMRFLGYRLDVMNFIGAADMFVLPSPAEPFGLVILEAMSLGKPVVACRAGGPREIVVDGETGFLVTPGRPAELAAAINRLVEDKPLSQSMGERGRDRYRREFTADRMAEQTMHIYSRLFTRMNRA
jgi:glycosyltransferase involved in cell wall biosynthesis